MLLSNLVARVLIALLAVDILEEFMLPEVSKITNTSAVDFESCA